ncbi:MAG: type IV pilus assembly protein PilM [Verrucomicrobia bacterium]|nr:type IV pilus assembly protein PilM [Verrucomicrobiota bacterium]
MLNAKSFLAVDFGAATLKLAEFLLTEDGGLQLRNYAFMALGQDATQETGREAALQKALDDLLAQGSYGTKALNICAPGFHTFSKFVKLPPVDTSKVTQIIQYEAQQNVPFPLEEVVWDYQILGANATGELEVLLVAIKTDVVERLSRIAENSGLRLQLVDISQAALCNAFRYNYADVEGCSMLLDIGAKTSNLLFFEKGSVYSRGINIGAHAITQEFSREAKLSAEEAERIKIEQGFVSLGGAYEDPDNPHQAAISKIARQVLTRLHIQVNQTIQFYRGQQGGSTPERLYLSGGASIMPYTAQFFSEKLNLAPELVEYFNPFRYVQIAEGVDREELAKGVHTMGEVVGLGLRNLAHCPVELNLMPKSSKQRQELEKKKPFFIAAAACLILAVFAAGWFFSKVASQKQDALRRIEDRSGPLSAKADQLKRANNDLLSVQMKAERLTGLLLDRFYWPQFFSELRTLLHGLEKTMGTELGGRPVGLWIHQLAPLLPPGIVSGAESETGSASAQAEPGGGFQPVAPGVRPAEPARPPRPPWRVPALTGDPGPAVGVELTKLKVVFQATNLKNPAENTEFANMVTKALQKMTNWLEATGTTLEGGKFNVDPEELVFHFELQLKLKRPIYFD